MSRDKGKPEASPALAVKIGSFDRYADALTGDHFRALGLGRVDLRKALKEFQSGDSVSARLLRDLPNSLILIDEHLPAQA
jgi:hypothetical protein